MKVKNLLLAESKGLTTKQKLINMASKPGLTKKQLLLKLTGVPKRMPTKYYNRQGRQFFLTLRGVYVIPTSNGKVLYGRKCTDPSAPKSIRPMKT